MPSARPFQAAIVAVVFVLFAAVAAATVVDSMEDGPFSLVAAPGATDSGSQGVSLATCIAGVRNVDLTSNGGTSTANLSITAFDDEIACVFGPGGAKLQLRYVPGDVDISAGGNNTHFVVDLSVAVPAGRVEVSLLDVSGTSILSSFNIAGPGLILLPLSDFAGVDLLHIQEVLVVVDSTSEGDYHVRDIRVDEIASAQQAADYIIGTILGGDASEVTLWTHDDPLDDSHNAVPFDPAAPPVPFPFPINRLFMIDDAPGANWGHPVRWVFVNQDATQSEIVSADWLPAIQDAQGGLVDMSCRAMTPIGCSPTGGGSIVVNPGIIGLKDECLYAVLISGGWNNSKNYSRYPQNLTSMYQILLNLGFPKSQIFTYYTDGSDPLDMDNADGDNLHSTGSDVTAAATESNVRSKIQFLCDNLDPTRDVLLIYTSNHGASDGNLVLWDFDNSGNMSDLEGYSPAEMDLDTENCKVCRLFGIFDQCYSGAFLPMLGDGFHNNAAFYAAALSTEVSYGREYLDWWEDLPIGITWMNDLHNSVAGSGTLQSTAVSAEGSPGVGNVTLDYCWGEQLFHIPSDVTFWSSTVDVTLNLCNELPSTQYYDVVPSGLPVGTDCDVPGPTQFVLSEPSPIAVGPGQCKQITITITKPQDLGVAGDTACWQVEINNYAMYLTRVLKGELHAVPPVLSAICFELPIEQQVFIHPSTPVEVEFLVQNTGPTDVMMDYELQLVASDGLAQNVAMGFNGMAPGETERGIVLLPGGETTPIPVTVQLLDPSSEIFFDLQLGAGPVGAGKAVLPIYSSIGLRQTFVAPTETQDPTPRRGPVPVELAPNPFNPSVSISFELAKGDLPGAALDVLDVRGRLVRTLAVGDAISAGRQEFVWNGRDDAGFRVASGSYYVRLRTASGQTVERAVLVK